MSERAGARPAPSVHVVLPGGDFLCRQTNLGPRFEPDPLASLPACGVCLLAVLALQVQAEWLVSVAGQPVLTVPEAAEALLAGAWGNGQLVRHDALRQWAAITADFPFTVRSGAQQ